MVIETKEKFIAARKEKKICLQEASERETKVHTQFDHKKRLICDIFLCCATQFPRYSTFLFSADVEHHQHISSYCLLWAAPKRGSSAINFLFTPFSLTLKPKLYTHTTEKEEKIANKFEMENLLIMSSIFSMRFITQMLIFHRALANEEKNSIS